MTSSRPAYAQLCCIRFGRLFTRGAAALIIASSLMACTGESSNLTDVSVSAESAGSAGITRVRRVAR